MLHVYLNYPNARVSLHATACGHIQQARKTGQRLVRVNYSSLGTELQRFANREYGFAARAADNDMWLDVEFADPAFEEAVVRHIHRLLGKRYKRFHDCRAEWHCR